MLKYRLIFGLLMIAFCIFCFWADAQLDGVTLSGPWAKLFAGRTHPPAGLVLVAVTIGLLIPLAAYELGAILRGAGMAVPVKMIAFGSMIACLAVYVIPYRLEGSMGATIITSVLVGVFLVTLLWHSRRASAKGAIAAGGAVMFAVMLLGLMPGFYLALRRWHSAYVVLAVLLVTKSCDIGAYFTGRWLGRHKMIVWLSPKKTWEGLIGGAVFAAAVAMGFAWLSQVTALAETWTAGGFRPMRYPLGLAAVAGVLFALVGQAGDLMMSLFKRDVGVKDSGDSVPGFGGVLDIFDSPLLVAPVAYWILELARHLN